MEVTKKAMEFLAKTFEGFGNGVLLRELHSSNRCHNSRVVVCFGNVFDFLFSPIFIVD